MSNIENLQIIINQDILHDGAVIGYGKPGHGMNGKDADIDRIGQCVVEKVEVSTTDVENADIVLAIHLRLYASISSPTFDCLESYRDRCPLGTEEILRSCGVTWEDDDSLLEHLREQATSVVCGMNPTPGDVSSFMWDGDGSWDGGTDVVVTTTLDADDRAAAAELLVAKTDPVYRAALERLSRTIASAIYAANEEDDPSFCAELKRFEDEVGLCNDLLNQCLLYTPRPAFVIEVQHLTGSGGVPTTSLVGPFSSRSEAQPHVELTNQQPYASSTLRDLTQPKPIEQTDEQ